MIGRRLQTQNPQAALVSNAGIPYTIPVELLPLDELRRVFEVNCVGLLAVTQVTYARTV